MLALPLPLSLLSLDSKGSDWVTHLCPLFFSNAHDASHSWSSELSPRRIPLASPPPSSYPEAKPGRRWHHFGYLGV